MKAHRLFAGLFATLLLLGVSGTRARAQQLAIDGGIWFIGGMSATGTIYIPAQATDLTVPLSSSNPSVLQAPASVTVPAGQTSATFTVTTSYVQHDTALEVTAPYNGQTLHAPATVQALRVSTITYQPGARVIGGNSIQAHLALYWYAPPGGITIDLSSDDPSLVTVPASVTVAGGSYAVDFTINTAVVAADASTLIHTHMLDDSVQDTIYVEIPHVRLLELDPVSMISGNPATATLRMNGTVLEDFTANISVDRDAVTVPTTVTVPAGQDHVSFTVNTTAVDALTTATLTASGGDSSTSAGLELKPLTFDDFSITSSFITPGGLPMQGQLTFNGHVPPGTTLTLSSDHPSLASVPATFTVPQGQDKAVFDITTTPVTQDTVIILSATLGSVTRTAQIKLIPPLPRLHINPVSIQGGDTGVGTLLLTGPAPSGGYQMDLTTDNPAISIPSTVTIPAGGDTATFTVNTVLVAQDTSGLIYVNHGGVLVATGGVQVLDPKLASISFSPASLMGGAASTGTVTLDGPAPTGGFPVKLSSNTVKAAVPASVTVPQGATSVTFTLSTSAVPKTVSAKITATALGVTYTATVSVLPIIKGLSVSPASVVGGAPATGTVTLNGAAPAGGQVVNVATTNTAASVPGTVTVPEGATSATFKVTTSPVTAATAGAVSASAGGMTKSATLTVKPPALSSIAFSPTSVKSGANTTSTVTLTGPAPAGFTVTLTSSNPSVLTVPGSVTFTAGSKTSAFTAHAGSVAASTSVTVTGKDPASITKTKAITVKP